jgi:hypothetical protein
MQNTQEQTPTFVSKTKFDLFFRPEETVSLRNEEFLELLEKYEKTPFKDSRRSIALRTVIREKIESEGDILELLEKIKEFEKRNIKDLIESCENKISKELEKLDREDSNSNDYLQVRENLTRFFNSGKYDANKLPRRVFFLFEKNRFKIEQVLFR